MKNDISLSIFFPAYNEEKNIAATVHAAHEVARTITDRYEIIIVNDGSSDRTGEIADRLAGENPRIRVVHHSPNKGYGAAVWSGIQAARYDWVFFTDADLQFRLEELRNLIGYIPTHEVVLGYRAPRRDPFMRLVNARGWNILNRLLFGLRVRDIDCAFKLFERRLVAGLPVRSRGAMMSAELLIRLQKGGVQFKQVPVTHLPRLQGAATGARPDVILRAFKEMFMLYRADLAEAYSTHMQAIRFGLVGLINTAVDVVGYYALTRSVLFFFSHLVLAKAISFFLGTVCSFVLNRQFTFGVRSRLNIAEIARFYSVVGASLVINTGLLYVLTSFFHVYDLLAVAITTIFTFIWSFTLSRVWVFRSAEKREAAFKGAVS